jgi:hypothetical protein
MRFAADRLEGMLLGTARGSDDYLLRTAPLKVRRVVVLARTRKVLWGQSGNRCALCKRELVSAPVAEGDAHAVVGVECHIVSKSPDGPRGALGPVPDPDGYHNLILLCGACHREVDEHQAEFPPRELVRLRHVHELEMKLRAGAAGVPAASTLLGGVRLRLVGSPEAAFLVDGSEARVADVLPPGGVVGRGLDAPFRLVGPAAAEVSRHHLYVAMAGRQWTAADMDSTQGTFEEDVEARSWDRLPTRFPIPVHTGMALMLAPDLVVSVELVDVSPRGVTTRRRQGASKHDTRRVRPPELEALAALLVRRGRMGAARSPESLAEGMGVSGAVVRNRLAGLAALEPVAALTAEPDLDELADALAVAFPYLLAARPDEG